MRDEPGTTPRLTNHARQRALEMGVCTKRVKYLVRHPDITRGGNRPGTWVVVADCDPEIAVVYAVPDGGPPIVLTVLYRAYDRYDRTDPDPDKSVAQHLDRSA